MILFHPKFFFPSINEVKFSLTVTLDFRPWVCNGFKTLVDPSFHVKLLEENELECWMISILYAAEGRGLVEHIELMRVKDS